MCWINLAITRNRLRALTAETLDAWERQPDSGIWGFGPPLWALITGDAGLVARATALGERALATLREQNLEAARLPSVVANVVGLSVLAHRAGADQRDLWARVVRARTWKDPISRALQGITQELLDGPSPRRGNGGQHGKGSLGSRDEWLRLLRTEDHRLLLDLALSPDDDLFPLTLDSFVLPLAWLVSTGTGKDGGSDFETLLRMGGFPARRGRTLFERPYVRGEGPAMRQDAEQHWEGFDAVELTDDGLIAYFYPLPAGGGDAWLRTRLARVEASWGTVVEGLAAKDADRVKRLVSDREYCCRVVYDAALASVPDAVRRAAAESGETVDFVDVCSA